MSAPVSFGIQGAVRSIRLRSEFRNITESSVPLLAAAVLLATVMDGGNVTEYLSTGATLVLGSITRGGVYNAVTRSISWTIASGSQVVDLSYSLASVAGEPEPVGQWQPLGVGPPIGILGSPGTTQKEADDALLIRELAQRPTPQEILDGRAGSVLIQKGQDGNVQLRFNLQTSEDLLLWTTTPETLANPITVDQPLDAAKRFFRFRMN